MAREYCEANGLPFDPMNPVNEVYQVLADYEAGLWDENKKDIKYYVDKREPPDRAVRGIFRACRKDRIGSL